MSKEIDWVKEVAVWRTSGLTAREFCDERGYSATRLYWWSSQLKRTGDAVGSKKSVPLARVVQRTAGELPRLKGTPIVVQVGRARVEVAADADRAALSVVLQALAATEWGARS